jgi:hypothetical protein
VVLIVALPLSCTFYDIKKSYEERSTVFLKLPSNASINEIKALLVDMDQGPSGLTGLTRGIVAVTLILVLAIAVFHLVVFPPTTVPHIAEQLLTLLAGTLTAITGFYFGTKAATTPTKSGDEKTGGSIVPNISRIEQVPGTGNKKLKVIGEGFGAQQGKGTVKIDAPAKKNHSA